jgi:hypothetical protein
VSFVVYILRHHKPYTNFNMNGVYLNIRIVRKDSTGYYGNIEISNKTLINIRDWSLSFDVGNQSFEIANCDISYAYDDSAVVTPIDRTKTIILGESVVLPFAASKEIPSKFAFVDKTHFALENAMDNMIDSVIDTFNWLVGTKEKVL